MGEDENELSVATAKRLVDEAKAKLEEAAAQLSSVSGMEHSYWAIRQCWSYVENTRYMIEADAHRMVGRN